MFCHNCGKQIPDGSTFCTHCGARQGTAAPPRARQQTAQQAQPAAQPAARQRQQQQKPKRKWTAFLIPVLVFFVAGLLGEFVIAPSMKKSSTPTVTASSLTTSEPQVTPIVVDDTGAGEETAAEGDATAESEGNPAYTSIFDGARVFHMAFMFGMDTTSYARKNADGTIECRDFGHNGDQVLTYVETYYYPGITSDQQDYIQALTDSAEQGVAAYSSLACANVTYEYNDVNMVFKERYEFTNLDQPENLQVLYDLGVVEGTDGISLSATEQALQADGFVKK